MRKRADDIAETRQRIVEAAVRLHGTIGPAATTISGLAEEAGVTRLTVYRDAAYRKSPVLLIESPHPGGVAG